MGTVIEFPKVRNGPPASLDLDELCQFGEVVFFTGVRYSPLAREEAAEQLESDRPARSGEQDATA